MKHEENDETPPVNEALSALDRQLKRDHLIREIQELGGIVGGLQEEPTEIELGFLERAVAWEKGPFSTHRAWLAQRGAQFIPPAELDDAALKRELKRLIVALSGARVFFYHTNHWKDRELYEYIWKEVLSAECPDCARTEQDANHWDLADVDDGCTNWLRYYATERERRDWQREFPEEPLPPRSRPPRRRDHWLPNREEL